MGKQNSFICLLRNVTVAALPEEIVRQKLIHLMISQLGYPKGNLALEMGLHQLPYLQSVAATLPKRRTDLICFAKGIHPQWDLYPLLVVECKSVKLTQKAMTQLIGYNHYLNARFIALMNGEGVKVGWRGENGQYQFIQRLPSYQELMECVRA